MAAQSVTTVLVSAGATAGLTAFKFLAAVVSGSAGMLAEAIHSLIDTVNSLMLYLGQKRSERPPDHQHPFGHGMELYFWTLIVVLIMFVAGGGFTIAEGVHRIVQPEELGGVGWSYAALGVGAMFNTITWVVAFREFRAGQGKNSFWTALKKSKDPTTMTVLFEDTASLLGLLAALAGLVLSQVTGNPVFDGIASVIIGILLAAVAFGLVVQCKTLLLGESAVGEVEKDVRTLVERDKAVRQVTDVRSMQFSPQDVLIHLKVRFDDTLPAGEVAEAVGRLERSIRGQHPECQHVALIPAPPGPRRSTAGR